MRTKILGSILFGFLILFNAQYNATAQDAPVDTVEKAIYPKSDSLISPADVKNINQIESFWQLTSLGGIFRWFIFLTLAIGLGLVMYELVKLVKDRIRSRPILKIDFREKHSNELLTFFREQKKSYLAHIGRNLLEIFEKTGSVQGFSEEISNALKQQEQQFNSFTTAIYFLSDTAGALGLLGTVWGMFITFFSETWDTTTILRGMGIALITTLLGLIVSIILNFCSTSVYRFFNKGLARATAKADELRLVLLAYDINSTRESQEKSVKQPVYRLIPLTQKRLTGRANQSLAKPIAVQLVDETNTPVQDKSITFELSNGQTSFEDGSRVLQVNSDTEGKAETNIKLGKKKSECTVNCYTDSINNSKIDFLIQILSGPPGQLKPISKELDYAIVKKRLTSPITVQLTDEFDNPVSGFPVIFATSGGNFGSRKSATVQVNTDDDGYASTDFIAGPRAEINNITAKAEGFNHITAEFKIMTVEK